MINNEKSRDYLEYFDEDLSNEHQKEITSVINKYMPKENDEELITSIEKNCLQIIEYLNHLLHKGVEIPKDLNELFLNNTLFIAHVNMILKNKISKLTTNDSISFSKELITILNILSIGLNEHILSSYQNIDFDALSRLFRLYENRLSKINRETKNEIYNLIFDSYLILLSAIDKICLLNSYIVSKENILNQLIESITESINILKYMGNLKEEEISLLNFIQGKTLYSYSHKYLFNFNIDDLDNTYKEYYLYIEKLHDGYTLALETNFGNGTINDKEHEFLLFQNNFALIVLDLINNIESNNIKDNSFLKDETFLKIKRFYSTNFLANEENIEEFDSLSSFKSKILDLLIYNYNVNSDFTRVINHNTIINDFIICGDKFKNENLETLYKILTNSKHIDNNKILSIGQILAKSDVITNDYYEFFKISIFDFIIKKLLNEKATFEIKDLISSIEIYINKHKNSSYILSTYFKLYPTFALFYLNNTFDRKKAKDLIIIFEKINSKDEQYLEIKNEIAIKIVKQHLKDLHIIYDESQEIDFLNICDNLLKQHSLYFLLQKKENISNQFTLFENQIIQKNSINIDSMYKELCALISNDLFYGLCKINIINSIHSNIKTENIIQRNTIIEIDKNFALQFVYPVMYEKIFKEILLENDSFIKMNMSNIFNAYKHKENKIGLFNS